MGTCSGVQFPVDPMTETTSQWQLHRREAGWEGSRRRARDPRNTNRVKDGAIRASQHAVTKPEPSRGRKVDAAGVRGRLVSLSGVTYRGVGLDESRPTPATERRPVIRQESAEAVVAAKCRDSVHAHRCDPQLLDKAVDLCGWSTERWAGARVGAPELHRLAEPGRLFGSTENRLTKSTPTPISDGVPSLSISRCLPMARGVPRH